MIRLSKLLSQLSKAALSLHIDDGGWFVLYKVEPIPIKLADENVIAICNLDPEKKRRKNGRA